MRLGQEQFDRACEDTPRSRISANAVVCRSVMEQLKSWHGRVVEKTDLDPSSETRGAAIWLVAGRCLGLLESLWVQIEAGIDNEVAITGRAIHEATRILMVFGDPEEDEHLRLWLEDEGTHGYVKAGEARKAQDRYEAKLDEATQAHGVEGIGRTHDLSAQVYDQLSRAAHTRRSSCVSSYWPDGRQMAYGRHPSPIRRASSADWGVALTIEVTQSVGDALSTFYGRGFFVTAIVPLVQEIAAVNEAAPLDADSLASSAGE